MPALQPGEGKPLGKKAAPRRAVRNARLPHCRSRLFPGFGVEDPGADADARIVADQLPVPDDGPDQSTLKQSIGVPLAIAEACLSVLESATEVAAHGARSALVDAGSGVFLARSAFSASIFTARSNVDRVSDRGFAARIERRAATIESDADDACERAMERIEARA
jgi:hypothetical protein